MSYKFVLKMKENRKKWTTKEILELYNKPLLELVFEAAKTHREFHDPREVQVSTLLSIKTGGCPEDCGYCPQASRYHTDIEKNDLMSVQTVKAQALRARSSGSSRVCMGAAWRNVKEGKDFDQVLEMVRTIRDLDMEVCCTLGMLTKDQARRLSDAGLYAYNHNIDTSEEYYKKVISTRGYEDRIETIGNARKAGLTVCSGGIIGMGESAEDRAAMLETLSNLDPYPESVPINALVAVEGTPMEEQEQIPIWDMIRMVATTRIVLPKTTVRLSAGRTQMTNEGQALCFLAGAGSIFAGDKLLTTPNPDINQDMELFKNLGLVPQKAYKKGDKPDVNENYKTSLADGKQKWSRPSHKIETNINAMKNGKLKRKLNQKL